MPTSSEPTPQPRRRAALLGIVVFITQRLALGALVLAAITFLSYLGLGMAVLLTFVACQSTPPPTSAEPPKTSTAAAGVSSLPPPAPERPLPTSTACPQWGGTLQVGGLTRPEWQNPLWASTFSAEAFQCLIFESLLALDPHDGHLLSHLAKEWEVGPGGSVITFTLRNEVKWHDGQPFCAEDVAFTWQAVMSATVPVPHAEHVASVSDIKVTEGGMVVVHMRQPDCAALTQLGLLPIVPAHLWRPEEVTQPVVRPALMVGTGPFRLADWETGETVTLTRQMEYWAGGSYLERWAYRRYEALEPMLIAADKGEIDLLLLKQHPNLPQSLEALFRPLIFPKGESLFLLFNHERPPLSDSKVRHGLALALDREEIAGLGTGKADLLTSILPPHHWSLPPDLRPAPYDPAEARRLLAPKGEHLPLTIKLQGGDTREDVALLVAQAYREVGIEARLEVLDWGLFLEDLFHHDFDVALLNWPFPRDPDQTCLYHSREITPGLGFNFASYVSPQADKLLDAGRTVEGCSEEQRAPFYWQLAALLAQDLPSDFLLAPSQIGALNRQVMGPAPSSFAGLYWNVSQWWKK